MHNICYLVRELMELMQCCIFWNVNGKNKWWVKEMCHTENQAVLKEFARYVCFCSIVVLSTMQYTGLWWRQTQMERSVFQLGDCWMRLRRHLVVTLHSRSSSALLPLMSLDQVHASLCSELICLFASFMSRWVFLQCDYVKCPILLL